MNTVNKFKKEQKEIQDKLDDLQEEINDLQEELSEYDEINEINENETLIHENDFCAYVIEMFQDMYDLPEEIVIDWEQTADDLQTNYTSIEINGNVYYYIA